MVGELNEVRDSEPIWKSLAKNIDRPNKFWPRRYHFCNAVALNELVKPTRVGREEKSGKRMSWSRLRYLSDASSHSSDARSRDGLSIMSPSRLAEANFLTISTSFYSRCEKDFSDLQYDTVCEGFEMTDIPTVKAAFNAADQFLHPILDRGRQMNIPCRYSMQLADFP